MSARHLGAAPSALALLLAFAPPAVAQRAQSLAPVPVAGAMIDDRYAHLRAPEAHASARMWQRERGANAALRGGRR